MSEPTTHNRHTRTLAVTLLVTLAFAATAAAAPEETLEGTTPSADGVSIHYLDSGSAPTALVFVHGWSCDATYWDAQVEAFVPAYRVVRVDLAGHGTSGQGRERYAPQAFGQDVVAVVRALELKRVVLVGHSMGGAVALEAARLLPGVVVAIVAVDTLQNADQALPEEMLKGMLASMEKDFRGFTDGFVRQMFLPDADPKLVDRVAADMASAPPRVARSAFAELFAYDEKAGLRAAGVPIVCINGTTWPTDVAANRKYAASFRLLTETGTGHFPMLERPQEFNRLLGGVLRDLLGDTPTTERAIVKEVEVGAPREAVWRAWTTPVGAAEFFAPLADIQLVPGGTYELYFGPEQPPGSRGGEGCRILAYLPLEMVSFEWNFPPSITSLRDSGAKTWVVVQLSDAGAGRTRVRLTQLGWREGKDWDEGYAYFDKAWAKVLTWLQQRFAEGTPEWKRR